MEQKVPKLKGVSFETVIIECYRRRESSVEAALIEMYLADVSVYRVEDITEVLWSAKVSPGIISNLNKKTYEHIEIWCTYSLIGAYPYVYVDGVYLNRRWGSEIQNVSILVLLVPEMTNAGRSSVPSKVWKRVKKAGTWTCRCPSYHR